MREGTKQVIFLLALVLSLAALVAVISWRLANARREQGLPSPASVTPTEPAEWP